MLDSVERVGRALERAMGGVGPPGRDATARILADRVGRDRRATDYRHGLRRGRCRRRGCQSRYGIVHVTVDTRDPERTDRSAVIECALCGRIWCAARVPDLRLANGRRPRVLITLIEPPGRGYALRIWRNRRGTAQRVGDDASITVHATYAQLAEALASWRDRSGRYIDRREKKRTEAAQREAADIAEARAWREQRDRLAAIDAALAAVGSPVL